MQYDIPLPASVKGQKLRDSLVLAAYMLGWEHMTPLGLPVPFTVPESKDPIEVTIDKDMTTMTVGDETHELTGSKTYLRTPGIFRSGIRSNVIETTYIMNGRNYSELTLHTDRPISKKELESLNFILYEILHAEALESGFTAPTLDFFDGTKSLSLVTEFISSRHENDLGGLSTVFADTVTYQGNVVGHEYALNSIIDAM